MRTQTIVIMAVVLVFACLWQMGDAQPTVAVTTKTPTLPAAASTVADVVGDDEGDDEGDDDDGGDDDGGDDDGGDDDGEGDA
ncbi:uncharacterized protein [Haliotis cracherodii]|uniref:uncharacterized protein n=1 Tax=Haliotis cracherodii TaxID=6455 RepID=UPI0039E7E8DB